MRPTLVTGLRLGLVLAISLCGQPLSGQWAVSAEVGSDRFWGGSVERSSARRSFRPYRPTTFGAGLERQIGPWAFGMRLRYASASLALEGPDAVVAAKGIFTVYNISPEVAYRIASLRSVHPLVLHLGPVLEIWRALSERSQTRLGVHGAVSVGVPLGGRLAGSVSIGAALIPSPFGPNQLNADFDRRALWRRRFAAGLKYRL